MSEQERRPVLRYLALVVFIAAGLLYVNSLGNGFVWDDSFIIVQNPLMQGIKNLPRLLVSEDTFPGVRIGCYRPVAYFSFFLNRLIGGGGPFSFHLVNLLLHATISAALYVLIARLFQDHVLGFLAALLFAAHPINAETVNFLSGGRNTLLAALFTLMSFITYARGQRRWSIVWFGLSAFSKEFGLITPAMLYVYDRFVKKERKPFRNYAPYIAAGVVYLAVRSFVLGGVGPLGLEALGSRLLFVPRLFADYMRVFLFAVQPKLPRWTEFPEAFDTVAITAVLALFAVGALIYWFRSFPAIRFSGFWLLLYFLPAANIQPIGYILMADRHAYFMSMGISLLAAFTVLRLFRSDRRAMATVVVVCLLFSAMVVRRNAAWRSNETLYRQMIADAPDSSIGYQNLGMLLYDSGESEQALAPLERAVATSPVSEDALFALGTLYAELGMPDRAVVSLQKTAALNPDDFRVFLMLSRLYEGRGELALARSYRDKALGLMPQIERILALRAKRMFEQAEEARALGSVMKAERFYRRALLYDPQSAAAQAGLRAVVTEK